MIFLYYHFSLGYILSFGLVRLRTIQFSARAGAHIECRCSRSHAKDVTITNVIIKTPDRKWDWGVNDVMPGSEGLGILVIFEKDVSWVWSWAKRVEIWSWAKRVEIWSWTRRVQFVAYGMHRVFVGSDGTVSIVKIVSLSPRAEKLKVKKKVNKHFVPELKKVVSVSGFLCMWTFYVSVYFTYFGSFTSHQKTLFKKIMCNRLKKWRWKILSKRGNTLKKDSIQKSKKWLTKRQ